MLRVTVPPTEDLNTHILGRLGSPSLVLARAGALKALYASETTLSAREREGMRIRSAHIIGCNHCLKVRMARDMPGFCAQPIEEEFYANVLDYRAWAGFTLRERLAIEFCERFSLDPFRLRDDDAFWDKIGSHFNEDEIADLCLFSGTWLGVGNTMMVLGMGDACDSNPGLDEGKPRERKLLAVMEAAQTRRG